MKRAVLFDLGNTLAEYYESCAYPDLLPHCIAGALTFLGRAGFPQLSDEELWRAVDEENFEEADHRVRPLEGRLLRIFHLEQLGLAPDTVQDLCRAFMKPIFDLGRCYEDTLPTLRGLREAGVRTAIVSNAPWGCPAALCQEEARRLGVTPFVDAVVFCTDVGWRKPARQIFEFAMGKLGVRPGECLFVGDHPEWDLAGPRALGMEAVLLDRNDTRRVPLERPLRTLDGLWHLL